MNGTDEKELNEKTSATDIGVGSFALRVGIKTVLIFLVVFSLAATLIGCLFPKTYMNLYRSMGAYGKASVYASAAVERTAHAEGCTGNCEYTSLLADSIGIAAIASSNSPTKAHAERLYDFTDKYLNASCHQIMSAQKDAMYITEYAKERMASLSMLYGYDDYVCGEHLRAAMQSGVEYSQMLSSALTQAATSANAEVLNMTSVYLDLAKSDAQPYQYFFNATAYAQLITAYADYNALATALGGDSVTDKALKASLAYRLYGLAIALDEVESTFAALNDASVELKALVAVDIFGKDETARARAFYVHTIS